MKPSTEVNGITLLGNQRKITIRYGRNVIKWLSAFLKGRVSFKAVLKSDCSCSLTSFLTIAKHCLAVENLRMLRVANMAFKYI